MTQTNAIKYARIAAKAADEKIGEDILAFDVRRESSLADCYVLITGTSHIHIRALEDAVREELRKAGAELRRTDGQRGHVWRALDYGSLIVHLMDHKTRDFYAMEKLWERAKKIEWNGKPAGAKAGKAEHPAPHRKPAKKRTPLKKRSRHTR